MGFDCVFFSHCLVSHTKDFLDRRLFSLTHFYGGLPQWRASWYGLRVGIFRASVVPTVFRADTLNRAAGSHSVRMSRMTLGCEGKCVNLREEIPARLYESEQRLFLTISIMLRGCRDRGKLAGIEG